MYVSRPAASTPSPSSANVVPFQVRARPLVRERDFGIGYGKSSGYATDRRYTPASQPRYFRFA